MARPKANRPDWMSEKDFDELRKAVHNLENPSVTARVMNELGKPADKLITNLSPAVKAVIDKSVKVSMDKALDVAVKTLDSDGKVPPAKLGHKLAVGATGALGGAFGLPALALELPVSTGLVMRSIADIARSQGEDIKDPEVMAECLKVFALGGKSSKDDGTEDGYYAIRTALGGMTELASQALAGKAGKAGLERLMGEVSKRFGIKVSEAALAKAVPVIGAATGASVNVVFMDHFQKMAEGHFIMRRLERQYGPDKARSIYEDVYQKELGEPPKADRRRQVEARRRYEAQARKQLREDRAHAAAYMTAGMVGFSELNDEVANDTWHLSGEEPELEAEAEETVGLRYEPPKPEVEQTAPTPFTPAF
ncbi:MAG: hypothetical protein Alpg2KO_19830 [Alphaproteobacteria bacterium]